MEMSDLINNGSQISVAGLFVWFVLKRSKANLEERARNRAERAEVMKLHGEERIAVQENFKQFLTGYTERWSGTQDKLAESLSFLSVELSKMSAQNSAEHSEILTWIRSQKL